MRITKDMLKAKGACVNGYRDFCKSFPEEDYPDGVEYQELLNACTENNRDDYADWLLYSFGRTNDEIFVDGDLISDKPIYVCGSLKVTGNIKAGGSIKAGGYIEAGGSIKAGGYIKAGWYIKAGEYIEAGEYIKAGGSIKAGGYIEAGGSIEAGEYIKAGWYIKAGGYIEAGGYIKAGDNYGIYAGLCVRLDSDMRYVKAKTCPQNLMCGEYVQGDVKR